MLYIIIAVLLSFVKNGFTQNYTVDEYLLNIDYYKTNALNWTFPTNSYSYLKDNSEPEDIAFGAFDFIICGAGSSGTVLASRLSEIGNWTVLLLEAGSWENEITDIPGMTDYFRTSDYNWGYNVKPQVHGFKGFLNNSIEIPRGKAIGGSSVINAMIYARGNKDDFDKWANQTSADWSYENVLPYFKKSEHAAFPNASSEYHGENGTLNVEYSRIFDEVGQAFLDAQVSLGRKILDYNGLDQMGFSILQMTEINGRRDSGGKAFIRPAVNRTNLHILNETLVTKIVIDKFSRVAYGVRFVRNGNFYFAAARKEVIVSAGALNSPQLLMLSGIGPRQHLWDLGIDVIYSLPVGENLWDHLIYDTQSFSLNYTYKNLDERTQVEQYLQGEGDLTSPDNVQCIGYASVLDGTAEVPDVEYVLHTSNPAPQPYQIYKNFHRYTEETYESVLKPAENQSQGSIHTVLLHPKSRGVIRLKSKSPFEFPVVDPRYFTNPLDVETLVNSIKDTAKMLNTTSMRKYNATFIKVTHPACNNYTWGSDMFWRCMVINLAETVHHFGGSCKMGQAWDLTAVVDPSLKVIGIRNLRVADCSVIPVTLSGHTNANAFMLAEKASDIIKKEHGIDIS